MKVVLRDISQVVLSLGGLSARGRMMEKKKDRVRFRLGLSSKPIEESG